MGSGAPNVPECPRCCQPIGNGSPQGKRERGKGKATSERAGASEERKKEGKKRSDNKPTSPQKGGTPPYCKEQAALPLITNSRQKISKKSPWGRFEKIFGKIFRWNVSGVRKTPCVISTEGVLTNENREISNLGNANNQKRTKALLNNRGQR